MYKRKGGEIVNKQKRAILGVMVLATLIMGVAYAAVSTIPLTITGNVTTNAAADNFKVYFSAVTEESNETNVDANVTNGSTSATLNISGLTKKNDSEYAIFEITNGSNDVDAESVTVLTHDVDTSIIQVDAIMCDSTGSAITDYSVDSGKKTYVKVTVTLLQTPTADNTVTTIEVDLEAVPEQAV